LLVTEMFQQIILGSASMASYSFECHEKEDDNKTVTADVKPLP